MKRRDFLGTAGGGVVLAGSVLTGCGQQQTNDTMAPVAAQQTVNWKMVSTLR